MILPGAKISIGTAGDGGKAIIAADPAAGITVIIPMTKDGCTALSKALVGGIEIVPANGGPRA